MFASCIKAFESLGQVVAFADVEDIERGRGLACAAETGGTGDEVAFVVEHECAGGNGLCGLVLG